MKKLLLTLIVTFAICGFSFAQYTTHYPGFYDPDYESQEALVAAIVIDGQIINVTDANWQALEVVAFTGTVQRSYGMWLSDFYVNEYGDPFPIIDGESIYYTTADGAEVSFKMYDHMNDIEYNECIVTYLNNPYTVTINGEDHDQGWWDPENPIMLNFTTPTPVTPVTVQWEDTLGNTGVSQNVTVPDNTIIIIPDGYIAYADDITFGANSSLVIEDGGQLICNNPVDASVIKGIAASAKAGTDKWYTISSPVDSPLLDAVTNLVNSTAPDNYAMFIYNEPNHLWLNQKKQDNASLFNNLTNGRGYLYWNTGDSLVFNGTLNVGPVNYPISYTTTGDDFEGFNLIGNPYPHNISKGVGGAIESDYLTEGYYVLNNDYEWQVKYYDEPIKPTQGIMVEATEPFTLQIQDINATATAERGTNGFIELVVSNERYNDVTYTLFSNKAGLTKINRLNAETPRIYFQRENGNFAIATINNEVKDLAVNFEAGTTGNYDLNVKTNAQFDYLHLIDNMTGTDIDLLATPSYSFDARTTDYTSRFRLVFAPANQSGDDFGFFSNGNLIIPGIEGEATLQVIDVIGRVLSSETFSGSYNKAVNASAGVYMIRLIQGNDVRTQKIVIK